MEPDLGGQEKVETLMCLHHDSSVAMEPDLGGQEKLMRVHRDLGAIGSQWSLTLEVRKSHALGSLRAFGYFESQWSLTLEVRKR